MRMMQILIKPVKLLVNIVLSQVYQILWLFIHFLYRWQFEIRETYQKNSRQFMQRLYSCLPSHSYYGELVKLTKATEGFKKIPRHVAFSIVENVSVRSSGGGVSEVNGGPAGSRRRGQKRGDQGEDCDYEEPIDLQLLAKVISWAWVARISVVSLYDYHGCLKKSYRELGCYIQEELIQNYWALKKYGRTAEPPTIKFHNVPKLNGYSNGLGSNGASKASSPLHIVVISYEDGKSDLIRATKQLYFNHISSKSPSPLLLQAGKNGGKTPTALSRKDDDNENEIEMESDHLEIIQKQNQINRDQDDSVSSSVDYNTQYPEISTSLKRNEDLPSIPGLNNTDSCSSDCNSIGNNSIERIDEGKIDAVLNRNHTWPSLTGISTDPDLLFILGNIQSTLGFLPWHIRLTEIHWLPKLQIVETKDFLQVLQKFARCEQRFGS